MTYVAQFSRRFPDLVCVCYVYLLIIYTFFLSLNQPFGSINKEHGELLRWVGDTRQRLTLVIDTPIRDMQAEYKVTRDLMFVFFSFINRKREESVRSNNKREKIMQTFSKKHSFFYLNRNM